MNRRMTNVQSRVSSVFAWLFLFLVFSILAGCSNGTDTAGVLTETESGHQLAGRVLDEKGKPVEGAQVVVYSRRAIAARDVPAGNAVSDAKGAFVIEGLSSEADNAYNVFVSAVDGYGAMRRVDADSVELKLAKKAVLEITPSTYNLRVDESLCFVGTPFCENVTEEMFAADAPLRFELPAMHLDSMVLLYDSLEMSKEFNRDVVSGDTLRVTLFTNSDGEVYTLKIPDSARTDYELPGFVMPISSPDSSGACLIFETGESACDVRDYAFMPKMTLNASELQYKYLEYEGSAFNLQINSRVYGFNTQEVFDGENPYFSTIEKPFGEDSTFYAMAWIKVDESYSLESKLMYSMSDEAGFVFGQCTEDTTVACLRIKSGENNSEESVFYGASKILDGRWHHYAFAFYQRHLIIMADGEIVRSTDIKVAPKFYGNEFVVTGGTQNAGEYRYILAGAFTKDILTEKESGGKWEKLTAWLRAEYYLQKQVYFKE